MHHLHLTTPVGTLALTCNSAGKLTRIDWIPVFAKMLDEAPQIPSGVCTVNRLVQEVHRYFKTGEPMDPEWIVREALETSHWSEFQSRVYRAVISIPHGETRTYAWVANRLKQPGAGRAVGQALRRNPHLIFVPCHRVVSAGDMGGFMGTVDPEAPELRFKQSLLGWEHSWLNPTFSFVERSA
ncbi:MAG: methylated-DNA--[protein]-cysteine S-methyltransferase [Oligoflexia bacterium]|jgi:methylated-DNA-[protein]-cysteine S-methyltransferase